MAVDSTTKRAHKLAAGSGLKKRDQLKEAEPQDHALGGSRGDLFRPKFFALERKGIPLAALVSKGEAGDALYFHPLLEKVKILKTKGRPRTKPREAVTGKVYDLARLRNRLRTCGIKAMIPKSACPKGICVERRDLTIVSTKTLTREVL